jgi:hypothetical protein
LAPTTTSILNRWVAVKKDKLEADLNCCLALDRFDFAMVVQRRNGYLVMKAAAALDTVQ